MKVGIIVPSAVQHDMWQESVELNRQFSKPDTPMYVLYNGLKPQMLPENVDGLIAPRVFDDECDLWNFCLGFAYAHGWDWCMMMHDDFAMLEPGWEDELAKAAGWRVALASHLTYDVWDHEAVSANASVGHLGVTIDSFSFAFNVPLFRHRGCVAAARFGFGYGAWDSCAWALQQGYALWRIRLDAKHHWKPHNTREVLRVGAPGHPEIGAMYRPLLPARVAGGENIMVANDTIRIAPAGVTDELVERRITCRINWDRTWITEGGKSWMEVDSQ